MPIVDYVLTREDLYAFQLRAIQKSPVVKRNRRNSYIAVVLAVVLLTVLSSLGSDGFVISPLGIGLLVFPLALVVAFTGLFEKRLTHRAITELVQEEKLEKGRLGRHTVKLQATGVVESTAVGEQRTSWDGVDRVEEDAEYIFIYTAPSAALVIPKRAFSSALEAEKFRQYLDRK